MKKNHPILEKYNIKYPKCGMDLWKGWEPLVDELIQKLIDVGWNKDLHQIKEKFGTLRFYIGISSEQINNLIREYEGKSAETCKICSSPGEIRRSGWLSVYCDKCNELMIEAKKGNADAADAFFKVFDMKRKGSDES